MAMFLALVIDIHFTVAIARLKFMVIKRSVISVAQYYNNLTRRINEGKEKTMSEVWNERGEAVLRSDGTIHHPSSPEGRRILRRVYGRNWENVERNDSIYDEDGGFYLEN